MRVEFPAKLQPLFEHHQFKSLHGGRDGGKSWGVAQWLIELAAASRETLQEWGLYCGCPELIVCGRETQNSIADSVHRLLENTIERLGLRHLFEIEVASIRCPSTGAEFVFKGLHRNPEALKSLERATRLWIEEAQSVSEESWRAIIPTFRVEKSEIILTWNPGLESDPTFKRFIVDPPPGLLDLEMNFYDNPWLSKNQIPMRLKMQRDDPDEYQHVWLGKPRRQLEGAIYANEMRLAESQGRIKALPYEPGIPVYTGWDLGEGDMTAIWFIQPAMGQYRVIDYEEDRHKPMSHYLTLLEGKGYSYAKDYFPWDASSKVLVKSLEDSMRQRGRNVQVLPRMPRAAGIDAVREMLGTCWFDSGARVGAGLQRLRYYRYGEMKLKDPRGDAKATTREPVHDDNSHGADALRTFAMGFRPPKAKEDSQKQQPPPQPWRHQGAYSPFG